MSGTEPDPPYVCCRMDAARTTVYIGRNAFQAPTNNRKKPESNLLNREVKTETQLIILVVEDVHETRDGIENLLKADGYHVAVARDEHDAIKSALLKRPDLILVSLAGLPSEVILTARRIRDSNRGGDALPVIVFCVDGIAEGDEVAIGENVHITRPDNFNQLRALIARLLRDSSHEPAYTLGAVQSGVPLFVSDRADGMRNEQDEKDSTAE